MTLRNVMMTTAVIAAAAGTMAMRDVTLFTAPAVAAMAGDGGSCGSGGKMTAEARADQMPGTIVDVAAKAGSFNTLLAAAKAAGLDGTLAGPGPFTVFAPTDEAFAKVDKKTLENLLKPENKATLARILSYHVVSGRVPASEAVKLTTAGTVSGQRLALKLDGKTLNIDNAKVTATDVMASNGIIHVIDTVLMPEQGTIVDVASKAGSFKTLITAAKAAGLDKALAGDGQLTVLAPTDEAFAKLPAGLVGELVKPENKETLAAILKYHVISGRVFSDDALKAGTGNTLGGGKVTFKSESGKAMVNKANLVSTDIDAANGVIHVIDAVLVPEGLKLPEVKRGMGQTSREVMLAAIERGAPMFNHGNHAACRAVYEVAVMAASRDMELAMETRSDLKAALMNAKKQHDRDASWTLREAMDRAMEMTVAAR
jgi:transforming growth factor-beta-induced protein